jgi:APA family basic amino acid/polyamine antiporter
MSESLASASDSAAASFNQLERRSSKLLGYRGAMAVVIANTIGMGVVPIFAFALAVLGQPAFVMLA